MDQEGEGVKVKQTYLWVTDGLKQSENEGK